MKIKSNRLTYYWMLKNTTQSAWIENKGRLLWLAFFFTEIGAGTYLVSLFINCRPGLLVGWFIALALGGFFHILFLGKPARGWRIFNGIASSELSRGLLIILFFAVIGSLQILPAVFPGLPWEGNGPILSIIMGVICILVISHGFLTIGVVKAVPIWNSPMMLPLSVVSGIWVGSQLVEMILLMSGSEIAIAEMWVRWSLVCFVGVLAVFLWWDSVHSSEIAKASIKRILKGDLAGIFFICVIAIGIIIPLIITLLVWVRELSGFSSGILFLRFLCIMFGDLMMRYCVFKSALYRPLI